jgi:hypothetical protein
MSKNDPADAIGGAILDVVKIGAWLSWEGGSALYNWMKTPLAVKLQRLTPKEGWGDKIEGVACASCNAVNQSGRAQCFACGQVLTVNEDGRTQRFGGGQVLKALKGLK